MVTGATDDGQEVGYCRLDLADSFKASANAQNGRYVPAGRSIWIYEFSVGIVSDMTASNEKCDFRVRRGSGETASWSSVGPSGAVP